MNTLRRRRGFTLMELLIVSLIIGILAMIAVSKFGQSKRRAYISAMRADLRNLATSAESRYATDNSYAGLATPSGSAGVQLVVESSASTFKGTATHSGVPGMTCTIEGGGPAASRAEPVCN
jgi:prepilin-type N-terminal cleavage/methylation domain-containing protein